MVILKSQKHVFWEALIISIFIFGLGILLGIFIENNRVGEISELYLKSEINLLDVRVQTDVLNLNDIDCENAIQKNIEFGDKVYEDAKLLQRYEDANKITSDLIEQHKKYDLLRTLFWINSIKIKEKCNSTFHTLVYLYDYNSEFIEINSKQYVFSKYLEEIKQKQGNNIILIPIARNLGLSSVDLMADSYGISESSIILDEKLVITSIDNLYLIEENI